MANSDYTGWTWMRGPHSTSVNLHIGLKFDDDGKPDGVRVEWHGGAREFESAREEKEGHDERA